MTVIEGKSNYIRMSARKMRLVVPLAKGRQPEEAITALEQSTKKAAFPLIKTIKQTTANAVNNLKINKENLVIKNILIEEGPTYKRWQPVSRGRVHPILKRTSHIRVILETKEEIKEGGKKDGSKS